MTANEMVFQDMPKEENTNFIWGDFIPEKTVDDIVEFVTEYGYMFHSTEGATTQGVMKDHKDSTDITLSPIINHPAINTFWINLQEVLVKYLEKFPYAAQYGRFNPTPLFNYQSYPIGGGYKTWHTERVGGSPEYGNRLFAWMTYLNDVPDGGTEWFHQSLYVPAQKGYTVIWPADWTHTHRGRPSPTTEKQIVTGWYEFA
jgi:hypothetical protein